MERGIQKNVFVVMWVKMSANYTRRQSTGVGILVITAQRGSVSVAGYLLLKL